MSNENDSEKLHQFIEKRFVQLEECIISRVLKSLQEIQDDVKNLSLKMDAFTESAYGGKTVQKKRSTIKDTARTTAPRKNILGYIKEQYIKEGVAFFAQVIEDAENTIDQILEQQKEELHKKKAGEPRKKLEAAAIWRVIKQEPGIEDAMKEMFKTHKEDIKKSEAQVAELENSSEE